MKIIEGGMINFPRGFKTGGFHCGLKKSGKKDLAILVSEKPATTAIMTTTNCVKAAPILWCNQVMKNPEKRAIIINSGNANACTGKNGQEAVVATAQKMAAAFSLQKEDVLIASTGVIGVSLPLEKIISGIESFSGDLTSEADAGVKAAQAILTTDTDIKTIAVEVEVKG